MSGPATGAGFPLTVTVSLSRLFISLSRLEAASFGGSAALRYSGVLDEVRVVGKPRSAAWIAAAYANQTGQMVEVGPTERPGVLILLK